MQVGRVDGTVGSEEHPDALCGFARLTDRKKLEEWGFKPREVMDIAIQGEGRSALCVQKKPEAEQRRRDVAVASAMTFSWGFVSRLNGLFSERYPMSILVALHQVHCDPHPGNILVRPHPSNPKKPQVVSRSLHG
jgi:aarF domain-containing kinase